MAALGEMRDRIRAAAADSTPLRIRGGGTKDFYGQSLEGEALDTGAHRGIVSFEPTELVVTARCGTPLTELEAELAAHRQMLAFEPPSFGTAATVGGVVAAGLSGPRRASAGAVRDFVLGASLIDSSGKLNRFGGQVMKNVAGYDVSRLLCGSLGILGVIAEVSLKVLPVPAAEATISITMSEADALRHLNEWAGQPWPISASAWHASVLRLRMSGARAAVDAARERFVKTYAASVVDSRQAESYWAGVREQTDEFFSGEEPLWRLSLPSTAPALALPGRQLIEWGGALRWKVSNNDLFEQATRLHGHATRYNIKTRSSNEIFQPLQPSMLAIQKRIKRAFDPENILNPNRLYKAL